MLPLRSLRQQQNTCLLWIDAICFNQEDLLERARQARTMDKVFARAANIAVCLGEHDGGSPHLFGELLAANNLLLQTGRYDGQLPTEDHLREMQELKERRWLKRVQVLREVSGRKGCHDDMGTSYRFLTRTR